MKKDSEALIEEAEGAVVDSIAETMDLYGITPSTGRLFARMYFKHQPMTLDDMKDDLGMSKPSMSIAVRNLQEVSIVKKVWQKGSRKDAFTAEKNFFKYFSHFFGNKWEREAKLNLSAIEYAEEKLQEVIDDESTEEELKERARKDYNQLEEYRKYCKWLERLADSIESGEIFEFLPIEEEK
ncbi:GbsR/MarR family transcriptional regulator [Salimicrobium jeotgali]|uniref:HTH-type transcriptional regulator n=1 Tax=Salimicrobium jeotgali TaxID=1230341 RepID=K2G825_9BACI|nr:GbsR/MarR family transcriptional regulator [Salimicrobium jeotgali]AKG03814.1 GbsR/MarR family transcriptional regulator [Salimicrobium jeotgali]EKE31308.1 transcriptional regulator [Salimicrobium jeotgali]MBM7697120.1 DNA-binding transcriptional regulator GbsR (MarR family) [Salimicrobium jeotgali]